MKFIQIKSKRELLSKIKTDYKLELLTHGTMRLLGSTKKDVDADKIGEIIPKLESVELVLVHCNLEMINSTHQKFSLVLFQRNNLDS